MKMRQTNPTFEVEYNIDNKRDVLSSGKNMQRNCFEPLCDNQLCEDSEIGRV